MHQPTSEYFDQLYDRMEVIHERYGHEYACGIFMSMLAGLINRGLCPDNSFSEIEDTKNKIEKMASEIDEINRKCQPNLNKHEVKPLGESNDA